MLKTYRDHYPLKGLQVIPATASGSNGPWSKAITGSATVGGGSSGMVELALTSANEAQVGCLYFGDILSLDIDDIAKIWFWAAASASFAGTIGMGLSSARNSTLESMTALAMFKLVGNNNVVLSSDDGTTDKDDVANGLSLTLGTTPRLFCIDFISGLQNNLGRGQLNKGGKADVIFSMGNGNGSMRRVGIGTNFDMSAYSSGLQPNFQIQKANGTGTGTLYIGDVEIERRAG